MEAGQLSLVLDAAEVPALLEEASLKGKELASSADVLVVPSWDARLPLVRVDPVRIPRALATFVAHALREAHLLHGVPWSRMAVVLRSTILPLVTPDEVRGRVNAVEMVFIGASNELGEFESGVTAAWFGTVAAVVVGGCATLAVAALWARLFPELATMDRLPATPIEGVPGASPER